MQLSMDNGAGQDRFQEQLVHILPPDRDGVRSRWIGHRQVGGSAADPSSGRAASTSSNDAIRRSVYLGALGGTSLGRIGVSQGNACSCVLCQKSLTEHPVRRQS